MEGRFDPISSVAADTCQINNLNSACGSWNAKDHPQEVEFLSYKNIANLKWMRDYQMNEAQSKAILDQNLIIWSLLAKRI
jgi:hypothetical protein